MPRRGIPEQTPHTPEEELAVQRVWLDHALTLELDYFSPVYHPHSIYLSGPDCRVVELLLRHVRQRGVPTSTYAALYDTYGASPGIVPGRHAWTWGKEQKGGAVVETGL